MKNNPARVEYLPHESDRVMLSIEAWNVANGADFDPATLHDWSENIEALTEEAAKWELIGA